MAADDADRVVLRDRLALAVREAGAVALRTFRRQPVSWIKGASSPVSEADLAVDALLRERLLSIRDAGWLSEETEDDPARLRREEVWIVDPIDGTRGYLAGLPDWVVAAALVRAGRPLVAALYAPVSDELFLSVAGEGATLNGAPIAVSPGHHMAGATFSGAKRRLDSLAAIEPRIVTAPRIPSLALRLARVATGALDGTFVAPNSRDWDLAAADLLVHEAGGLVTTLTGESLIYNRPDPVHGALVAAGRDRHARLLDLIRDRLAEFA
ncbi:MAG TPA: 3'(2'),5'-bisphosphate nucleotidase CysQ [Xanthobacteraceae bacterium]|nr:3'(2'),5'-bisphosphate nucleotidase CysQ [Xanthobacteraceae bacterium]